jgi:hypothetical protein
MHPQNFHSARLVSFLIAALGAGMVTSFAVGQGQSPFLALGITGCAAAIAVTVENFLT